MCILFYSSETPLTLAVQLDNTVEVIKALKNGGAHLDFRAKDGMTALHKAARAKNQVTLKVNAFSSKLHLTLSRKIHKGKCIQLITVLSPVDLLIHICSSAF